MIDLLRWALQRHERSGDAARKRLRVILVLDRVGLSLEHMEGMKRDIMQAVSKYMVVDEESMDVEMRRSGESLVLVSNVQIREVVRAFADQ